jgi:hypothetical protein
MLDASWLQYFEQAPNSMNPGMDPTLATLQTYREKLADNTYHVPTRFGISGILAITTLMAILFGIIQRTALNSNDIYSEASTGHPLVYITLSLLIFATCLVQMKYGTVPRMASMATGGLFFTSAVILFCFYDQGWWLGFKMLLTLPALIPMGMFLGYLAGTLTAGCFLLVDKLEQWSRAKLAKPTRVLFSTDVVIAELVEVDPENLAKAAK